MTTSSTFTKRRTTGLPIARRGAIRDLITSIGGMCLASSRFVFAEPAAQQGTRRSEVLEQSERALDPSNPATFERHVRIVLSEHVLALPEPIISLVVPRLARGEIKYRAGAYPGVHENQLVSLFNEDVKRLSAPTFAQITQDQVRHVRLAMVVVNPLFMGCRFAGTNAEAGGDSIHPYLSPLQAIHLGLVLADQKDFNPLYQCEPEEWPAALAKWNAERAAQLKLGPPRMGVFKMKFSSKKQDLEERVSKSVSTMGPGSLLALAEHHLSAIGV